MEDIRNLIYILNKATYAYDIGKPFMTDAEWDKLYFELEKKEKESGTIFPDSPTQTINYEVINNLEKITHEHDMLSLAKTKDWNEFIQYFDNRDVVGMLKLDGLTISLTYENGQLMRAETRGNGIIGENVIHNARVITSIPSSIGYKDRLVIDGEILCTKSDFESFEKNYANSRNFASGSLRLLDSEECKKRKLTFMAWNVVEGFSDTNSFLQKLENLAKLGFLIVPWTSSWSLDAKEHLLKIAEDKGLPIDGLVGRFDDIEYGKKLEKTSHHEKAAYAFKFADEDFTTRLLDIEYETSRNGQLVPVAVFEPVSDGNTVLTRASLHNLSVMHELSGGFECEGDILTVFRANMIIPQVKKWEHHSNSHERKLILLPTECPICKNKTKIRTSENDVMTLWCDNPKCQGKIINSLEYIFAKDKIEIKGLSKATLGKLIEKGWIKQPRDIFELKKVRQDWIALDGFGVTSVDNILNAIEESKNISLDAVICAAGIPLIGKAASKVLAKQFKTWDNFRSKIDESWDFAALDGFGYEMNKSIQNFDYDEIDFIVKNYLNIKESKEEEIGNSLEGQVICITGKLNHFSNRDELKSTIENNGGKVVNSISKKTNILINNDINSSSSKNVSAKKLNIPIVTEEEFLKNYLKKFDF